MKRLLLCPLFVISLFCGPLSATEQETTPFPEVIPVEHPEETGNLSEEALASLTQQVGLFYNYEDAYLYRLHGDSYEHLFSYSATGDEIQLHDGSFWWVSPSDLYVVLGWAQSDNLFIQPQSAWFSSYPYKIYNYTRQQSVSVRIKDFPPPYAPATFHIVNIDYYNNRVFLSDNTVWQVDSWDTNFKYWQIGQRLIIGIDNYWTTANYPNIMINVDIIGEPYSRANFYGYPIGY